jgi:hypothetical protein
MCANSRPRKRSVWAFLFVGAVVALVTSLGPNEQSKMRLAILAEALKYVPDKG